METERYLKNKNKNKKLAIQERYVCIVTGEDDDDFHFPLEYQLNSELR